MSRRGAWTMGLVLVAVLLVSVAVAAPPKDAMVIGLLAEPVTMDPPQITDLNSTRVIKRMFEGLTAQELGTYKIIPGLAQSWDISKDGLTYTFHLRPNVKFHTGQPIERIEADSDRDRWFTAEEAKDYGFIDEVIERSATVGV